MPCRPPLWTGLLSGFLLGFSPPSGAGEPWQFVEVAAASGVIHDYSYDPMLRPVEPRRIAGGVAAEDYDGDGDIDLFFNGGEDTTSGFFRNLGDGTYEEVGTEVGVSISGAQGSGPIFADIDGDGLLDLLTFSISGAPEKFGQPPLEIPAAQPRVFRNLGDGTFADVSAASGLVTFDPVYSSALADYDGDGDLDLFLTHWNFFGQGYLWRNLGDGTFEDVTMAALGLDFLGLAAFTFTPNFVDVDGDGWLDILMANDFDTSLWLRNRGDGTFEPLTPSWITDENGMGAALGDYDNDGDLDWFVSSIWDPDGPNPGGNWGDSGNRLYRNLGGGVFEDATDEAGVREGLWGWGSCFADFNLDGHLDLFHVNGWQAVQGEEFNDDLSKLFISNGDGTFTERSAELGLNDSGQGRGVACFDSDGDGDLDVAILQNGGAASFYRNDWSGGGGFLIVRPRLPGPNTRAIGAVVRIESGGLEGMRLIQAGSNYASQSPAEAHFGLGGAAQVDRLRIEWPDGGVTNLRNLPANRILETIFVDNFESGSAERWTVSP